MLVEGVRIHGGLTDGRFHGGTPCSSHRGSPSSVGSLGSAAAGSGPAWLQLHSALSAMLEGEEDHCETLLQRAEVSTSQQRIACGAFERRSISALPMDTLIHCTSPASSSFDDHGCSSNGMAMDCTVAQLSPVPSSSTLLPTAASARTRHGPYGRYSFTAHSAAAMGLQAFLDTPSLSAAFSCHSYDIATAACAGSETSSSNGMLPRLRLTADGSLRSFADGSVLSQPSLLEYAEVASGSFQQ